MEKYKSLKLTNNSKVRSYDGHFNTFSLRSGKPEDGGSCPCATEGKGGCLKVCYAASLRKRYKGYAAVEDENTALLQDKTAEELFEILDNTVTKWRLNGGDRSPYFRLHTSGDLFNDAYAHAWSRVIKKNSDIRFWLYTRSLFAVHALKDCEHLTILLSCDPVNQAEVLAEYNEKYKDCKNISVAFMGDEFPAQLNDRPVLVCPEITGKMKNTKDSGACLRCRACVDRTLKDGSIRHIRFPIHK